jgi:hypothetical protein
MATASQNGTSVNLFSFLDIMAATIGVQLIMILVVILGISDKTQKMQLLPEAGSDQKKFANYILCDGNRQVELLAPGLRRTLPLDDPGVAAFLKDIQRRSESDYLVFGVRPKGYADFIQLRKRAEALKLDLGYEPINQDWQVRLPEAIRSGRT